MDKIFFFMVACTWSLVYAICQCPRTDSAKVQIAKLVSRSVMS